MAANAPTTPSLNSPAAAEDDPKDASIFSDDCFQVSDALLKVGEIAEICSVSFDHLDCDCSVLSVVFSSFFSTSSIPFLKSDVSAVTLILSSSVIFSPSS